MLQRIQRITGPSTDQITSEKYSRGNQLTIDPPPDNEVEVHVTTHPDDYGAIN